MPKYLLIDVEKFMDGIKQKCILDDGYCEKCLEKYLNEISMESPTNGEMIKALFPNTIYSEATEITIAKAFIRPNGSVVLNDFYDNWWNAPYKRAEHE